MATGSGSGMNQSEWQSMEPNHALKLVLSRRCQQNALSQPPCQHLMPSHPCLDSLDASFSSFCNAVNRLLPTTAKGRIRWSRAILTQSRHKWRIRRMVARLRKHSRRRFFKLVAVKKLRAVEETLVKLRRRIPGCEKVRVPEILEEAIDYMTSLDTQIRNMGLLSKAIRLRTINYEMSRRRCGPSPPFPAPTQP